MNVKILALVCSTTLTLGSFAMDPNEDRQRRIQESLNAARRQYQQVPQPRAIPNHQLTEEERNFQLALEFQRMEYEQVFQQPQPVRIDPRRAEEERGRAEARLRRQRQEEEERGLAEARRLQRQFEEEERRAQERLGYQAAFQLDEQLHFGGDAQFNPFNGQTPPITDRFNAKGMENRHLLVDYKPIAEYISNVPQQDEAHKDSEDTVHVLDLFVLNKAHILFGMSKVFNDQLKSPDALNALNMSLLELQVSLCAFVDKNPQYFPFWYEGREISGPAAKEIIIAQITKSKDEIEYLPLGTNLWAQAYALILEIHHDRYMHPNNQLFYVRNFYSQLVEGWLTRGGCIQGFVDRGFVVLTTTLGNLAGLGGLEKLGIQEK